MSGAWKSAEHVLRVSENDGELMLEVIHPSTCPVIEGEDLGDGLRMGNSFDCSVAWEVYQIGFDGVDESQLSVGEFRFWAEGFTPQSWYEEADAWYVVGDKIS